VWRRATDLAEVALELVVEAYDRGVADRHLVWNVYHRGLVSTRRLAAVDFITGTKAPLILGSPWCSRWDTCQKEWEDEGTREYE